MREMFGIEQARASYLIAKLDLSQDCRDKEFETSAHHVLFHNSGIENLLNECKTEMERYFVCIIYGAKYTTNKPKDEDENQSLLN